MDPSSAAITAAAWAWDKYGKSLTDKAAGALKGGREKFGWKKAAESHRAKIKKLYGTMQIMGMAEPVPLDDISTDTYVLDRPTAPGRYNIESLKQLADDEDKPPGQAQRIHGLRLVREKGNLFILGKPGAGKTTFLQYIALRAAEQNIDTIPVFAGRLRDLMVRHGGVGREWDLTAAHEARLADYLNAVSLLQECLALAYMPSEEKEAVQDSLYLPPNPAADRDAAVEL